MKDYSLVPDARNLMESTRSIGYSLPAAVADIIDNSIAAQATEVVVTSPTLSQRVLTIFDNGKGMNETELLVAMKYGSRSVGEDRSESDLGRFGLGLKMASLSQCRCLTVVSRKCDGQFYGARWDLDHVAMSCNAWPLQVLEADDIATVPGIAAFENTKSGTLVVWEKLDLMLQGIDDVERRPLQVLTGRMADLKRHLSLVFHRYLAGKDRVALRICFNGQVLAPMNPFLEGHSTCPFAEDSFRIGRTKIYYQAYILPHPSNMSQEDREAAGDLQRDQGFYIYRNRRLVIWGTWFRLSRKQILSKLARVRVDFPASAELDRLWSLDVKKSSATVPEELRECLRSVVNKLSDRSANVWGKRAKKQQVSKDSFWKRSTRPDGMVAYEINDENETIKELVGRCPEAGEVLRLVAAKLPLDSLYLDLAGEKTVDVANDKTVTDILASLRTSGFNC